MDSPQHIGIFGGTFDPVHEAHLRIARAARDQAGLDRVLFVVSGTPPHKRDEVAAGPEDRYAMVEAAIAGERGFEASRVEIDRTGPSYTADTLRTLREDHPGARMSLILGYDAALDLPKWREPQAILSQADLLVVARPDWRSHPLPPALAGKCRMLEFEETTLSSTGVRDLLASGGCTDGLLPPRVLGVIRQKGLYGCR